MKTMPSGIYLTLYPLDSPRDWEGRLAGIVSRYGYTWSRGGKVWLCDARKKLPSGIEYTDGFQVSVVRLGPRYHCLTINPHIFYFESCAEVPSDRPSWELLRELKLPLLNSLEQRIGRAQELHYHLSGADCGVCAEPVELQETFSDLLDNVHLLAGPQNTKHHVSEPLGRILQMRGFQKNPTGFEVLLASPENDNRQTTLYGQHLVKAFARAKAQCQVRVVSWLELMQMVEPTKDAATNPSIARVLLIGVYGKKGQPLTAVETSALKYLDEIRISYRMFSLDNSAMNWAAFDQISILTEAAGGRAYSIQLPCEDAGFPLVFIGLDLGHPLSSRVSWVVATIVDNSGHLIGFWRQQQERDETLREKTLTAALNWIYLSLRKMYRGNCRIIVLRDGRLFENENFDIYTQFFGKQYILAEVIKHPVPLMLAAKTCAPEGTMCIPKGSVFSFLLTSRSKNHSEINLPLKIRVVHDGLQLGLPKVNQLIAGLSYAPSLGLSPTRLPAPIYWANGLAATSNINHQFSGIHWVEHT